MFMHHRGALVVREALVAQRTNNFILAGRFSWIAGVARKPKVFPNGTGKAFSNEEIFLQQQIFLHDCATRLQKKNKIKALSLFAGGNTLELFLYSVFSSQPFCHKIIAVFCLISSKMLYQSLTFLWRFRRCQSVKFKRYFGTPSMDAQQQHAQHTAFIITIHFKFI